MRFRLLLLALLLLTGCDVPIFGRPPAAEPPPKGWEQLGIKPGTTVKTFRDPTELDRWCEEQLRRPAHLYEPRARYGECFVPATQTLAMLDADPKVSPDPKAWQERQAHGGAHSWGLVHPRGDHEWIYPDGRKPEEMTPARAELMLSMARAEQQRQLAQAGRPMIGARGAR